MDLFYPPDIQNMWTVIQEQYHSDRKFKDSKNY